MKFNSVFVAITLSFALFACEKDPTVPSPPPADHTDKITSGLKDITWSALPAPFYHFTYNDSNYVRRLSYSDGLADYEISYLHGKISTMKNLNPSNRTTMQFIYGEGKVTAVKYLNEGGQVFKRCFLDYTATGQLAKIEWERSVGGGFAQSRTMTFSYWPDGNLAELINNRHAIEGFQTALIVVDQFSSYDTQKNVDDFSLIHPAGDELLFLPSVKLQINNPLKNARSGDGIHYTIDYTYQYDDKRRPIRKTGDMFFQSGPDAGKHFAVNVALSYY